MIRKALHSLSMAKKFLLLSAMTFILPLGFFVYFSYMSYSSTVDNKLFQMTENVLSLIEKNVQYTINDVSDTGNIIMKNLMDFCMNHQLSMTNLLLLGIRTYLSKVNNGQEDITIQNFISRRSTHEEWTSGGSRTIMFPCRTVISPETDFLSAAYEIQNMQNRIYMHSNYDPAFIVDEMRKRYHTPEHTSYESCYLTYQPMPVKVENEMLGTIRQHAKWFANGAATKKMYLTVSHTEDGGMNFSYHYQTAHLEEHDMELLYYYMMRILFKGIAEPDMSIGEIMELV